MTTIRDIAKKAKVSVGTISNYLNNPDIVAEETRLNIKKTIEDLDYHPKAAARSLKSKFNRRIGLVPLINIEDNHSLDPGDTAFLEFLSAVNTVAAENNFDILLSTAIASTMELNIYKRLVGESQVDGIVMMGMRIDDPRVRLLHDLNFPFITYGQTTCSFEYSYVDVDGYSGIYSAVELLYELRHRKIAYLKPPDDLMLSLQRWNGFQQAAMDLNIEITEDYLVQCGFNESSGQFAMNKLLDLPHPPTAVIAPNDLAAFGAMRALQLHGLVAGKDISIVGFDDIKMAAHWYPSLTTISQPFRRIGFEVVKSLIGLITGTQQNYQSIIQPQLIVRQSTGPVP